MENEVKNWLVRTRSREILGPYSQRELLIEVQKNTFSPEDEIAPSQGHWISAETLLNRDTDEFTRTSTRNFTVTHATASITQSENTNSQKIDSEDLTPAPEFLVRPTMEPPLKRKVPRANPKKLSSNPGPIIAGLLGVAGLWILANYLKPREMPVAPQEVSPVVADQANPTKGSSPFVRKIYSMIQSGQNATALQELNQYHESKAAKGDLEYLIPYSALLITEGESPSRARKYLNSILVSSSDRDLKAQAHRWLGYLSLSQGERDFGESHFLESLQLNPRDAAARFNLGRAYLMQKRYLQAIDYLNLAEPEVQDKWLVHIYKGRARMDLEQYEKAAASFKQAVDLSKDRWICYIYYALFWHKTGRPEKAMSILSDMLRRDPRYEINSPPALGLYQEGVNYGEYLNAYNHMTEKVSGPEKEMGKLYISYLLNGPDSAEAKRIEAVAEKKEGLMAKVLALKVALDRQSTNKEVETALERLPNSVSKFGFYAYVLRGEAYLRLGKVTEARTDFSRALTLEPLSAISNWANAMLLKRQSREDEARQKIRALLGYHPNYIPALVYQKY